MDKYKVKFSPVKVIGEEKKVEEVKRSLTDKEVFNDLLKKVEEFLLKPSVIDYLIYMESLIQVIVLLTAIFLSWLITRMGLSIAYVFLNICFFSLIYAFVGRVLTKKYEMKMRAEAQKPSLNTNQESIEWLNFLLQKIWGTIEPVATEMVPDIVDGILKDKCPPFLHSIRLTKFNLGSEAPRLESVETFDENLEQEEMQMIWHASFVPVTAEENKYDDNKRTTEIQATAFVGNDKFQVPLNINVANLLFEGKILLRVRFTHTYPFVKTASVSFMEPPKLSCTLKPLVGIDLMSIPGVQEITDITIKTVLKEIALNPTTFDLDLENMLKATSHDDPTGVLKINLMEGRGLKNIGKLGNTSDPYLRMNLGGNEIARTKNVENDLNPFWNETKNLIIPLNVIRDSFIGSDNINFEVYDKNKTADKLMGRSEILKLSEFAKLIDELEEEALNEGNEEQVNENGEKKEAIPTTPVAKSKKKLTPEDRERIIKQWGDPRTGEVTNIPLKLEGKDAGSINIQVSYHPVQKPGEAPKAQESEEKPKSTEDATENNEAENTEQSNETENLDEYRSGVLRVHLYAMKDLEKKKGSRANPYAIVEINHEELIKTEAKKRTNNPVFSETREIYVKNINTATLKLTVKDKNSIGSDPVIGNLRFKIKPTMKYLLENPNDDWLEITDTPKGRVRFGFDWFPVKMVEENENSPAIGVCRINIKNANNLKKADTLGLSDPYTKLFVSGRSIGQTVVIDNTINPVWDESFYAIIQSRNDRVKFEIYDYNNINSDKKLGSVEYYIKDICDNISEEVVPTDEFKKLDKNLPKVKKLEDGRFNVTSSLFEKQQKNATTQGEFIFEIQYFPISVPSSKETKSTEVKTDNSEETKSGTEVEKRRPKISGTSMSGRGFSMFTASQMGISSSELKNISENNVSGILRIKLEEAKNLRVGSCAYTEFSFDNRPGDIFHRSSVIKSNAPVWDEIIEGFIMNIIHNKLLVNIRIRAKESGPSESDTSLLALQFELNDIASNLNKSVWFTKKSDSTENEDSLPAIKLAFGYAPINIIIPPVDYLPNMGVLTVNVDDGEVDAMDSSGTSDPFVIFKLNGNEIYKTKEQKKTLKPIWNERFDVNIYSRYNARLVLEVYDWNKIESKTIIGTGVLPLANINTEKGKQSTYRVEIFNKETKKGHVNLILDFIPQRVYDSKQSKEKSSESGAPAKVINNVAKGGISVAKGVVKAPSSVVSGIASGLSKTFKSNKNKNSESKNEAQQQPQNMTEEEASEINDGLGQMPPSKKPEATAVDKTTDDNVSVVSSDYPDSVLSGDEGNNRRMSVSGASESYGMLHIHVISANDILAADSSGSSDPYVKIMRGKKEIGKTKTIKKTLAPTWNEQFKVNLGEVLNQNITLIIKDHNNLMSSKTLGEVQITEHNSFSTTENKTVENDYPISKGGTIKIKLEYIADEVDPKAKKSSKKK
ncbi:hypothetical protein H8356DRAFT_940322 [Neocallimastix lanati (nom. inval.)]|nr:hypothetical protein H8356DRAFT_940322 [Neocallimastix sp. JGI-2020a]